MIEMIVRSKWGGRSFSRLPSVVTQPCSLDRCNCTMIMMMILGIHDNFDDDDADYQRIMMTMMTMMRMMFRQRIFPTYGGDTCFWSGRMISNMF